ncbi:YqgE/AlgH family protein [Haliangium ochraceum]|uniref:UPF0301 protein Hoch_0331 n=1 Tax=Haliangium ochraceum (strain DSM 14365 / JCM 11303 / SMP-2) TaxID=502025 RepID=D0LIU3_HALO1|nr:YqgE/AlgH family protein [Haliangium ochraceum]ACY12972.1 protein of unknown function DUF179 [Haliangium ochraceum DSM 14365]
MIETELAPGLLLAMPHLLDPNFRRSVVLMVEHDDEGSFGLVVNQPTELSMDELYESLDLAWKGSSEAMVWRGGPVMPTHLWLVHAPLAGSSDSGTESALLGLGDGGTVAVGPELRVSGAMPELIEMFGNEPPAQLRVLLGYAGWGGGQLAQEMSQGAWLHVDATPELIFETPAEEMWERAVRTLGINPETIIHGAGIH